MKRYFKFQIEDFQMTKSTLKNEEYVLKRFFSYLGKSGLITLPKIDYTNAKVNHKDIQKVIAKSRVKKACIILDRNQH